MRVAPARPLPVAASILEMRAVPGVAELATSRVRSVDVRSTVHGPALAYPGGGDTTLTRYAPGSSWSAGVMPSHR
jgi:hypothetical protein